VCVREKVHTSNTGERLRGKDGLLAGRANGVSIGSEGPETLRVVDISVCDVTSVLGVIGESKVVHTGLSVLEQNTEDGLAQGVLDIVKESLLRGGANSVDAAEGKAEKTIDRGVVSERAAGLGGDLDGLLVEGDTSDLDSVFVDVTAGRAAIAVADVPGGSRDLLGVVAGGVVVVALALRGGGQGRESPAI
jgi:hypothetical protein